jgi:hypothetical protein
VEGIHEVGGHLSKIRINCVLNYLLHYSLCIYFYGFFSVYDACVLLVLFPMNLYICRVFVFFSIYVYS